MSFLVLSVSSPSFSLQTGVQNLVDTRKEIERWADAPVSFHFSGVISPWVQRALISGGFGTSDRKLALPVDVASVVPQDPRNIYSVQKSPEELRADAREQERAQWARNGDGLEIHLAETGQDHHGSQSDIDDKFSGDEKHDGGRISSSSASVFEPLVSLKTPFFHFDIESAVRAAAAEAKLPPPSFKTPSFTAGH